MPSRIYERALAADELFHELVDVPEWGAKVLVRAIAFGETVRIAGRAINDDGTTDVGKLMASLLAACCYDPDTNEPVFASVDEAVALMDRAAGSLKRLSEVASRLSKIDDEVVEGKGLPASIRATPSTPAQPTSAT